MTLFTGQWADIPLSELAPKAKEMGYDGLELACWGDHMDVFKAAEDKAYCQQQLDILKKNGLELFAISNHLAGQLVCDLNNDSRSDCFAPADCAGDSEKKRKWAIESMTNAAKAAKNLGIKIWRLQSRLPFEYWMFHRPIVARKGPMKGKVHRIGNGWPSSSRASFVLRVTYNG